MIIFKKVRYCEIEALRNKYFDSIHEAQELYVELLVKKADYYRIEYEKEMGYFAITPQNILVEFFITETVIKNCELIFTTIINDFAVEKVYCKSFDSILLKCCPKNAISYRVIGTLFRDCIDTKADAMEEFLITRATDSDIPRLLQYTDGLYESAEELHQMVKGGNILMYHLENQFIGCGFLTRVVANRKFYDIGMWVNSAFRKKGFATRIIAHLKGYCLENDMIPICGCAAVNLGSKKTLEKNGFFSRHDLVEFQIQ